MATELNLVSPTVRLANHFAAELSQSRDDLRHLSKLHADFVGACFVTLDAKRERSGSPLLGEVFPHLVAQGLVLDDNDRRMLAAGWLALYGYISLVDYELDQKGHLDARASIAASALLGWGIATLSRHTIGTKFEGVFFDNINRAFAGQYEDLNARSNGEARREAIDVEKNRASVVIASAYCAAAGQTDDRLVRATETLLGAFQILDDLEDLKEDHGEDNITSFVRIARGSAATAVDMAGTDMYRAVIADPRSQQVLLRAIAAFDEAILLLDYNRDHALIAFISDLKDRTSRLVNALDAYQHDPRSITEPEIMQRIAQIASSC